MSDWKFLNGWRVRKGEYASTNEDGFNGAFAFPLPGVPQRIQCIASDGEEFRTIAGYEGSYEVSNIGRVKSLSRIVPIAHGGYRPQSAQILSQDTIEKGYKRICLGRDDKRLVHVLVAESFIKNDPGYPEVNHRDGNKSNNVVTNLEWCTKEYNIHHAIENGLTVGWTSKQIECIRVMILQGMKCSEIAKELNASRQSISDVKAGRHRDLMPDLPVGPSYKDWPYLWQHVSVTLCGSKKPPSWDIMCRVKELFWEDSDCVVQFHPPKDCYVNNHPGCLHLWRCTDGRDQPMPDSLMVGVKDSGPIKSLEEAIQAGEIALRKLYETEKLHPEG